MLIKVGKEYAESTSTENQIYLISVCRYYVQNAAVRCAGGMTAIENVRIGGCVKMITVKILSAYQTTILIYGITQCLNTVISNSDAIEMITDIDKDPSLDVRRLKMKSAGCLTVTA